MEGLVSILIPAYNAERWISETILSAKSQTWQNCEIIIVDDGSSDNTWSVAKKFESKTVKVVRQDNMGASAARNKALSLAQGQYIQWLDADDLLAPDKISRQLKSGDYGSNSLELLSCAFGKFFYRRSKARFIRTALWQDLAPIEWLSTKFNENVWMNPAVWLLSRKLVEQTGPWDERLSLDDDGEYFVRAVAGCQKVRFVPEACSYYRITNLGSLSNTLNHAACESLFLSLELCIKNFLRLECSCRTKSASLKYLQIKLIYFYPEEQEILQKVAALAKELEGELSPPKLNLKYIFIKKVFGWQSAKNLTFWVPKCKKSIAQKYDKIMSVLAE